jgi:hypothetical protein
MQAATCALPLGTDALRLQLRDDSLHTAPVDRTTVPDDRQRRCSNPARRGHPPARHPADEGRLHCRPPQPRRPGGLGRRRTSTLIVSSRPLALPTPSSSPRNEGDECDHGHLSVVLRRLITRRVSIAPKHSCMERYSRTVSWRNSVGYAHRRPRHGCSFRAGILPNDRVSLGSGSTPHQDQSRAPYSNSVLVRKICGMCPSSVRDGGGRPAVPAFGSAGTTTTASRLRGLWPEEAT